FKAEFKYVGQTFRTRRAPSTRRRQAEQLENRIVLDHTGIPHEFDILIIPGDGLIEEPAAMFAFELAARAWEFFIKDPVQVVISADLISLEDPNVIGQASSVKADAYYQDIYNAIVTDSLDEADDAIVKLLPSPSQLVIDQRFGYFWNQRVTINKSVL